MSEFLNSAEIFDRSIIEHLTVIREVSKQKSVLERISAEITRSLLAGGKVLWCGNGGSAADCQHLAAEFVGRFRRERRGLSSIALTTDSSILTAVSNDYGYDQVFCRQVEALCVMGDILVAISTSGNSKNVLAALQAAKLLGATTVAFTGEQGGDISAIADLVLRAPSTDTARIQETHILCGHILCELVEQNFCAAPSMEGKSIS
jgi:D-sedoheptulose 7-phosphate isomerase